MLSFIHRAALQGLPFVVLKLLRRGANVNARTRITERTPLHLAAVSGITVTVKALLENGADPNSKDSLGDTPFIMLHKQGIRA
jgi:ankyrin repeat protein